MGLVKTEKEQKTNIVFVIDKIYTGFRNLDVQKLYTNHFFIHVLLCFCILVVLYGGSKAFLVQLNRKITKLV